MKKRRRDARSGTAGWMIGCTLMPRANSRSDSVTAFSESHTMTGTTARPG